jgi:hypothetical protein
MPGSLFEINCRGCGAVHPISTGESTCWTHVGQRWSYEQWVCPRCKLLKSRQSEFCCREEELICETCRSELMRWSGRVWFDRTVDGMPSGERVDGPCPRCRYPMSSRDPAPDGRMHIGLWD